MQEYTPQYLNRDAAAFYLKSRYSLQISVATLAKYACIGGGPLYRKEGRFPIYARLSPLVSSTSEYRAQKARRAQAQPAESQPELRLALPLSAEDVI